MTGSETGVNWKRDAARARWRYWGAWLGSPMVFVAGLLLAATGLLGDQGWLTAIGGAIAGAGLIWSTAIYIRVVDEQERDATLWASYAAICVYFALFVARWLPVIVLHRTPAMSDKAVFVATMAVFLGVFSWKRFR